MNLGRTVFSQLVKLPPALPLFKFVSIDTSFCQRILRLGSVSFVKPLLHSLIAKVSAISKPVRACPLDDHRLVSVASPMGRLSPRRERNEIAHAVGPAGQHSDRCSADESGKSYCFRDGEQEIQYGHDRLAPTHVSHGSDTDVRP
jgi:hypothetical protein